jgi:hypothetical protein
MNDLFSLAATHSLLMRIHYCTVLACVRACGLVWLQVPRFQSPVTSTYKHTLRNPRFSSPRPSPAHSLSARFPSSPQALWPSVPDPIQISNLPRLHQRPHYFHPLHFSSSFFPFLFPALPHLYHHLDLLITYVDELRYVVSFESRAVPFSVATEFRLDFCLVSETCSPNAMPLSAVRHEIFLLGYVFPLARNQEKNTALLLELQNLSNLY